MISALDIILSIILNNIYGVITSFYGILEVKST